MTSLRGEERTEFPSSVRKAAFRRCCRNGEPYCEGCGNKLRAGGIFFEHMQPDGLQGKPTLDNCEVRCAICKKAKDRIDNARMAKADRVLKASFGLKAKKTRIKSRGFGKTSGQHRATTPIEKWKGY